MVPMTMLAMNGSSVPVKYGMPMLMAMAASMLATSSTGMEMLLKERAMMTRTARMDQTLTFLKSTSATSIRSLVMAPSPVITPSGSTALIRRIIWSSWSLMASVPVL